jgi:peptidoglycan/LPS O-acetylase OafA/YrhL
MFAGFARLKVHFSTGVFAANTYSIYLIHAFLLDIISRLSRAVNGQRWLCHLDARFAILLLAVLIYVLSCGLGILLHKICAQSKKAVKA